MKIVSIDQNEYSRNFLTIEIEEGEKCCVEPYAHSDSWSFFPKDKSGRTAEVRVKRWTSADLTGRVVKDHGAYNVGNGSGPAMGWTLGLELEQALNLARGICAAIESRELVARVYHNVESNY